MCIWQEVGGVYCRTTLVSQFPKMCEDYPNWAVYEGFLKQGGWPPPSLLLARNSYAGQGAGQMCIERAQNPKTAKQCQTNLFRASP